MPIEIVDESKLTPDPSTMSREQYYEAEGEFYERFRLANQRPIQVDRQRLYINQIDASWRAKSNNVVMIYFGLYEEELRYGFAFGEADFARTPVVDGETGEEIWSYEYMVPMQPTHILIANQLERLNADHNWADLQLNYENKVKILSSDETGATASDFSAYDPCVVILPWTHEIGAMLAANVQPGDTYRLRLESVSVFRAETSDAPAGFRHGIAFVTEKMVGRNWEEVLDEGKFVVANRDFQGRAVDFGGLCPPGDCSRFERRVR